MDFVEILPDSVEILFGLPRFPPLFVKSLRSSLDVVISSISRLISFSLCVPNRSWTRRFSREFLLVSMDFRFHVGFSRVVSPVQPSLEESKVVTTEKSLNRCRSPEAFHSRQKAVRGKCAHCRRLLLREFEKEKKEKTNCGRWVCSFCRSHWFQTKEMKCYRFCKACQTFHLSL